jgi:hypothetical protein
MPVAPWARGRDDGAVGITTVVVEDEMEDRLEEEWERLSGDMYESQSCVLFVFSRFVSMSRFFFPRVRLMRAFLRLTRNPICAFNKRLDAGNG